MASTSLENSMNPAKYSKRVVLKTILSRSDGGLELVGKRVVIGGWVRSCKEKRKDHPPVSDAAATTRITTATLGGPKDVTCIEILQSRIPLFRSIMKVLGTSNSPIRQKLELQPTKPAPLSIAYLLVNDGSCASSLQVLVEPSVAPLIQVAHRGISILAEGVLRQPSVPGKHIIELIVEKILHVGNVDPVNYPLAKTKVPIDILRDYTHFRPRTTTVASITRIRSALSHSTHTFFQNNGFLYVHMPVITTTDANGFSEKFQVTTLFDDADMKEEEPKAMENNRGINLEIVKAAIKEKSKKIEQLKRSDSNKEALFAALQDLQKANELSIQLEEEENSNPGTLTKAGKVDFSKDFFSCQTYLTVSSQLHLESYACALGSVYTFGPVFQAEKSQPLAELWMVEVEMAFSELEDVILCAEDYLKFLCQSVIEHCSEDMKFLSKRIKDKTSILHSVASKLFERITYMEALDILKKVADKKFKETIEWGMALTEEHESYLADDVYKRPVTVYNHPKEVKPFYMRLNDDGTTVSSIDIIVPEVGTVIRGGQREERIEVLSSRIKELRLPQEQYEWYIDLRRHGSVKHSGFSLGLDNLVLLATGLTDVRDVIPFPRSCGNLKN